MVRMRLLLCSLALVLTVCCLCFGAKQIVSISGQAGSSQSSRAQRSVTGTVINSVTGEPIRRALVRLNGPTQSFAFTTADGHFQMDGVQEGAIYLSAEKPGFSDPSQTGNPVILQTGVNQAVVKLIPQSVIQGRILDSDGEPIEGVQLQLLAQQITNGRKEWQMRQMTQPSENGTYRLENLMPGAYLLSTMAHPVFGFQFTRQAGKLPQEAYPQRFYPNSPDLGSAQPIDLKPGEQAEADFTLPEAPAFSVSGSVGPVQDGISISIGDADGQQTFMPAAFNRQTGRFRLPAVPSGSWILSFHSRNSQGAAYYGEQTINVGSSDIAGLQVLLQPLPSIPVNVADKGDASPPQAQVQLIPDEKSASTGNYMATPSQAGDSQQAWMIRNVAPGRYGVSVQSNGPGCIDSVSSGSADLTHDDLIVTTGSQPPPINVTFRDDCATLSGEVHGGSGDAKGFVILLPGAAYIQPNITPIQSGGHFAFGNLSPGEYQVYAFSNIEGLEYANPEALRGFTGQRIDLEPNQKANVTVDLMVRGSN